MFGKNFQSKKKKESRKRTLKLWFIGGAVGLVVLFIGGVIAFNQSFARIDQFLVTGQDTLVEEDIVKEMKSILEIKSLWIFPHDTLFFYSKKKVTNALLEKFSRIRELRLRVESFDILHVEIVEHDPQYLWCGDGVETLAPLVPDEETEQTDGEEAITDKEEKIIQFTDCYYMDDESYIFSEAPYFSDHVFLKFVGSHHAVGDEPLRQQVFQTEAFKQVLELAELLKEIDVSVNKILVEDNDDYVLYVDTINGVRLGTESRILVNLRAANNRIIENLKLAFRERKLTDRLVKTPESLEYIDLRFDDKIVYRFRQAAEITPLSN